VKNAQRSHLWPVETLRPGPRPIEMGTALEVLGGLPEAASLLHRARIERAACRPRGTAVRPSLWEAALAHGHQPRDAENHGALRERAPAGGELRSAGRNPPPW
jgi:hypothetical protein